MELSLEAKRQLLAQRLEQKAAQTRHNVPLSYGQEALWFLHQQSPESAAYHIAFAMRVYSELDTAVLQRALRQLVLRHTALRTVFPLENGRPVQAVLGYLPPLFEQIAVDDFVRAEVEAVYKRPFNLENGPLFRVYLFTRQPDDHLLLLCFHHIICDAWAIWTLVGELGQLLQAEQSGGKANLTPAPAYETFVRWQAEQVQQPELLAYWQTQLAGELPTLNLPTDNNKSSTGRGASHFFSLDAGLFSRLKTQAQTMGVTPFMFLLAVYQVLLYRYAGQEDIIVGSPTSGRGQVGFATLVGYLVNPIPLRVNLGGNPSFAHFLQQVRRTVLDGLAHQDYPLPLLARQLSVKRSVHVPPLFQTLFVYQKPQMVMEVENGRISWGGLLVEPYEIPQMEGQFDVMLEVTEQPENLQATLKYNPDLWQPATIQRMAHHWQTLLAGALAQPDCPIAHLPLLTDEEKQQILVEFNDTARPYPTHLTLHQLFEQQVEQRGGETAVKFRQHTLTYAQLNERANQLAHYLQNQGVRPETMVGVCMERSMEMVVALYAILKAGAAYVPLDPSYPAERLRFMLADAQPPLLLTQHHLLPLLPHTETKVIPLDTAPWLADSPIHNPTSPVTPTNLAYMIYTSGSTGQPKGAMNSHAGIVNRLLWMQEQYQLEADDRILQKTPFSFDVSVWEFFWPLLAGACLIVAEPEGHRDGRYLAHTIQTEGITTLHFVPSMLSLFLQEATASQCNSLKRVICSGEALPYPLQEQFFATLPATELHNLYGPTETAVDVTHWHCIPNDPRGYVPIGRPIANTQLYIVDPHNQPVPIGVPGELLIGGVQVGRGYWRREELTAEKFVSTQYSVLSIQYSVVSSQYSVKEQLGTDNWSLGTVYRTGDLCRWRADGTVEYLGRLDFQVKLRGLRIELGEIETALMAHSAVSQAVVVAHGGSNGYLVAYVAGGAVTADSLRLFLRQTLPDHMIPAHFIFLENIPLSPNGKVNRRALPPPETTRPQETAVFARPQTPIEQQIAAIWQEVLNISQPGLHDNFFDLGGHSLLLAQARRQLETVFERPLPMAVLFQYPTIHSLAVYLAGGETAVSDPQTPPAHQRLSRRAAQQSQRQTRAAARHKE